MNITQRLLATLSLALLALLAVGVGGLWQLRESQERFTYFNDNTLTSVRMLSELRDTVSTMRVSLYRYALSPDAGSRSDAMNSLAKADEIFDSTVATYERSDISDETDRQMLEADRAAARQYRAERERFLERFAANDDEGARGMLMGGSLFVAVSALHTVINKHVAYNAGLGEQVVATNGKAYGLALTVFSAIIACGFLVTGTLGYSLYRRIHSSLAEIEQTLPGRACALPSQTKREAVLPFGIGAGDEARTRDLNLGKVALYQLSYSRRILLTFCLKHSFCASTAHISLHSCCFSLRSVCFVRSENRIIANQRRGRQAYFSSNHHFCAVASPLRPLRSRICGHASFM